MEARGRKNIEEREHRERGGETITGPERRDARMRSIRREPRWYGFRETGTPRRV